ncbi:unnamed protein product [Paramecium sonneborni]|uniref:Transmembrane protein n=1 Tax=Paramecium sonneborni TaxID=65129 RepID=A0A8S1QBQ3_9CILI|nr:unnamed protein product [Paramecium sonneborni]
MLKPHYNIQCKCDEMKFNQQVQFQMNKFLQIIQVFLVITTPLLNLPQILKLQAQFIIPHYCIEYRGKFQDQNKHKHFDEQCIPFLSIYDIDIKRYVLSTEYITKEHIIGTNFAYISIIFFQFVGKLYSLYLFIQSQNAVSIRNFRMNHDFKFVKQLKRSNNVQKYFDP